MVAMLAGIGACALPAGAPAKMEVTAMRGKSACERLIELGLRGEACDPDLAILTDQVANRLDESACTAALRRLIAPPTNEVPGSLYEADFASPSATTLRDDELEQLKVVDFPGTLIIQPDILPGPGVPVTSAQLGEQKASTKLARDIRFSALTGSYDLELRYADSITRYCVDVRRCEDTTVVAHAGHLDRHPAIRPGRCHEALASYAVDPSP